MLQYIGRPSYSNIRITDQIKAEVKYRGITIENPNLSKKVRCNAHFKNR